MKQILSLLLALTLCLGMVPANAWAEAAEDPTAYAEETESTEAAEETTLPAEPVETEAAEEAPVEAETEVVGTEALDIPEAEEPVTLEPITKVWINPEYRGLFSEADVGVSDVSGFEGEGTPCSSLEEVIEALREGLVNREESPAATLVTTTDYQVDDALLGDILDRLFDHTGVPTEGDYLRRDIGYTAIAYGGGWSTEDGVTTWTHTFILQDIGYFTTAAQEREMDQEVSRVLSSLALDGKTQKGKIDAIYDYLIHNVKYVSDEELADESNVVKYSSYAALVQHNAVCQGFAGAFYRLCLESGIDSRIVSSDAMNHAWNIVELGGSYYHLDATWDINWPDAPKYYLRGSTYWKAEHKSSTTGYVSELGDQFDDGSFAAAYPVPEGDYDPELVGDRRYTIVFDGNGAEIGSMNDLEAALDAVVTLPEANFMNTGYTFTGWNTQADGKGKRYQPGDQVKNLAGSGTVTLYAQWQPNTYTAIFLPGADDCKGSVEDMPNLVNGESYVFPKCGYTRTGYLFAGWGLERADDLIWNAGDKLKTTKVEEGYVAEFIARWTPITYTVRFNANKGTGKMPDQKDIPYGEAVALSENLFTRKGCRFTGWNTQANGTGETIGEALNLTAVNNGTVTLYAQWEGEPYEVTFHFGEETHTQTLHYGTAEALDGNPFENPGYTFKSWNTKENGKGKSYKDSAKVTNLTDRDLYAQWTANKYTVIFHSNLAKDTTKKQILTYGAKETALTVNSFSWKGHAFQGWTTEDGKTFANKEKVMNLTTEKVIDLYAVWKVNEYTVVFDPNGADGEEITQNMVYDVPEALTENRFGRTGYTFRGWAATAKGKAVHTDGKIVKNLTDKDGVTLRLYAVWVPTTYTVAFAPGEGATGAMKAMKLTYGKTYALTNVAFKRANYTFAGWADEETGETYANKDKVSDLSADGGTVTLVAQWVPTEYAVIYKNLSIREQEDLVERYTVLSEGMPGEPSRPGCEFLGWYLDSGCKKPFTGFENIAKPRKLTLYPKWAGAPSRYTVHFDPGADGVTGRMADKKNLVCGKDYTLAACAFKRSGYQFAGWEIGSVTLANKAKFSDLPAYLEEFTSGGTVTLTATWVKIGDGGDIPIG